MFVKVNNISWEKEDYIKLYNKKINVIKMKYLIVSKY